MTEALAYVLRVALTGIGTVFLFLAVLSLIMVAIRGIDKLLASARNEGAITPAPDVQPSSDLPVWAVAAVAVYLEAERARREVSASVWVRRESR